MDLGGNHIWLLALGTLVVVVIIALWQRAAVAKAKATHEHTAMTAGAPEQRKSDGSDPGTKAH